MDGPNDASSALTRPSAFAAFWLAAAACRAATPEAPSGSFEESAWVVAAAVGLLVATALTALWLVFKVRRPRTERALADRLAFERLLLELSARLIDAPPEDVDHEIDRALERVLEAMDLDRCSLLVLTTDEGVVRATHRAESAEAPPLTRELQARAAPKLFERIQRGQTVAIPDTRVAFPGETLDQRFLEASGIRSLLLVPVTSTGPIQRGVSFQTTRRVRTWSPDLVERLRLVSAILTSAAVGKRAEAALRASEARYREVVENQTELICRFRPDTTLTFVNGAYCRYFGRSREELIGTPFLTLIPEAAREATRLHVASLMESPRVEPREHEVLRPDGTIGWQQWINYAVPGRDGRIFEFQAVGRDVTDRKRAEDADRRLAQASRLALLGELTASIAHEIRQPLGAILSNADAAELLLDSGSRDLHELRVILADIRREDLRANDVIDRVRSLISRREMAMQPVDVNQVANDVLQFTEVDARRRGIAVEKRLESALPAVQGDRVWLEQVLLNLIVNAMEALADMPNERRQLSVRTSRNGHNTVEVVVADFGPGLSTELLPRLFESFVTTREHGMGLGLSISRSIVDAHGGTIQAENNPAGGATFRFTLPAAEA